MKRVEIEPAGPGRLGMGAWWKSVNGTRGSRRLKLPPGGRHALGRALRELRGARTLTWLALETGYSVEWLASVEGGRRAISDHHLARLAVKLGTTPAELHELAAPHVKKRAIRSVGA